MSSAIERAKEAAVVEDPAGHTYVVIHSGYSATPSDYNCGLAGRIIILISTVVSILLICVAQAVPYRSDDNQERGATEPADRMYYGMWQTWTGTGASKKFLDGDQTKGPACLCIPALIFLAVSMALNITMVALWVVYERQRRAEEAGSELALSEYGRLRGAYHRNHTSNYPYTNLRVMNFGQVRKVRFESQELLRRRRDRDVNAAALSMLIFSFLFVLIAFCMGASELSVREGSRYGMETRVEAGLVLLIIATVLCFIAFILNAIPQLTKARLCGKLRPERSVLMVADEVSAEVIWQELQQYNATANPFAINSAYGDNVMGQPMSGPNTTPALGKPTLPADGSVVHGTHAQPCSTMFNNCNSASHSAVAPPPQLYSVGTNENACGAQRESEEANVECARRGYSQASSGVFEMEDMESARQY